MTRVQLRSLGWTDKTLAAEYFKIGGIEVDLSGSDTAIVQKRRRVAFDRVCQVADSVASPGAPRMMGAFAADDPKEHAR